MVIDAGSRYFVELLGRLFWLTHNIVPHISLHDLPYHKTMKKYEDFDAIRTWFCNCPQYLCLFHIVFEYIPSTHDQGKKLILQKSTSWLSNLHIGSRFCVFPANLMSSTYTVKNNPLSRCTKRHSQFGIVSQPCFNRIFSKLLFP